MHHLKDWEQAIPRPQTLQERFEAKVNKEAANGCWLWLGSKRKTGYGLLIIGGYSTKRVTIAAHRLAYELFVGPIPDGLCIDHLCRNRHCVNPSHLEAVTNKENTHRGLHVGQHTKYQAGPTKFCPRGHEFTPENTRIQKRSDRPYPQRVCKTCAKMLHRAQSINL